MLDDLWDLFVENRIFKQRNVDIGVVTLDECWAWGFSGVMVRGSGAAWDLRRNQPYECYDEMDFMIPVGKHGDNYDRQVIRMEEMRESTKIIKQCVEKLLGPGGQGPVHAREGKLTPPSRAQMKRSMEALIHHFKLYTEGFHVPAGEVYAAVEGAQGGVRRLSRLGRERQALSLQDPRAGFRPSPGDGFHLPRAHARGRLRHSRLARHRLRRSRPVSRRPEPRAGRKNRTEKKRRMAVRRLAEIQPDSFAFTPENRAWVDKQIAKYPPGRQASAVMALLWRRSPRTAVG